MKTSNIVFFGAKGQKELLDEVFCFNRNRKEFSLLTQLNTDIYVCVNLFPSNPSKMKISHNILEITQIAKRCKGYIYC